MRSWVGGLLRRWVDRIDREDYGVGHESLAPARESAYRFVRAAIGRMGEALPTAPIHRNALIWRCVSGALEAYTSALVDERRLTHPPAHGQKLNPAGVAAIPVVRSSVPPSPPPPPGETRLCGCTELCAVCRHATREDPR